MTTKDMLAEFSKEKQHELENTETTSPSREVEETVQEKDLVYSEEVAVDNTTSSKELHASQTEVASHEQIEKLSGELSLPPQEGEEVEMEGEEEEEEDDEDDVSLLRMKSLIDGMMTRLEKRVTKTESELGAKLHKLDVDRDGVLNSEELQAAVMQVGRLSFLFLVSLSSAYVPKAFACFHSFIHSFNN